MKSPIRAIITDLDGVIRFFPDERDRQIEERFGLPYGSIAEIAFENSLLERVIKGKISDEDWREQILINLQKKFPEANYKDVFEEWSNFCGQVDHGCLEYLRNLRLNGPLILLTNATSRLSSDLKSLGIESAFDRIFNSSEMGLIKPDTRIFQKVCQELALSPNEALFIDDSKANVEAAISVGLHGIHFLSLEQLKSYVDNTFSKRRCSDFTLPSS